MIVLGVVCLAIVSHAFADESGKAPEAGKDKQAADGANKAGKSATEFPSISEVLKEDEAKEDEAPRAPPPLAEKDKPAPDKDPKRYQRLGKEMDVWIDKEKKQIVMEGQVCLTRGQLEMFACTHAIRDGRVERTKDHESIFSVLTSAQTVHIGLLAIGAKQGKTVEFEPKYVPASGTEIEIRLDWIDSKGKPQTARAQDWVRNTTTKKAMTQPWVFAGSKIWVDQNTGKKFYLADGGDFICVSNFTSAMMDLPVESSAQAEELMFEAFSEKIPPKGTKVTITLIPKLGKNDEKPKTNGEPDKKADVTPAKDPSQQPAKEATPPAKK